MHIYKNKLQNNKYRLSSDSTQSTGWLPGKKTYHNNIGEIEVRNKANQQTYITKCLDLSGQKRQCPSTPVTSNVQLTNENARKNILSALVWKRFQFPATTIHVHYTLLLNS